MNYDVRNEGILLPQNRQVPTLLLVMGLVIAIPTATTLWKGLTGEPGGVLNAMTAMGLVMLTVLVLLPLFLARKLTSVRALVTDDYVAWTRDGQVNRAIRFADIAEVEVRPLGNVGFVYHNALVRMTGQLSGGGIGSVVVSTVTVTDIEPLLRRLQVERARRPLQLSGPYTEDYLRRA